MCQIYPDLQVIPIWVASSMSSPLDFQTEDPGFESHQSHIEVFFFITMFFFFFAIVLKCSNSHECLVFFVLNQDRNFAIELKKWRTTRPKWSRIGPSWRAEMKVQYHMYAVFKCIAFQLPWINSPHFNGLKNYIYILNMCIMLYYHNHENVSYANLISNFV